LAISVSTLGLFELVRTGMSLYFRLSPIDFALPNCRQDVECLRSRSRNPSTKPNGTRFRACRLRFDACWQHSRSAMLHHRGNRKFLSTFLSILVRSCFADRQIARQPRVTDQNGFSRPLYANVAEYFQNVQFHERGLPARQKNAITECIRRFGTLFGLPSAFNVVFTVGQRQPGDSSKAVLQIPPSSS